MGGVPNKYVAVIFVQKWLNSIYVIIIGSTYKIFLWKLKLFKRYTMLLLTTLHPSPEGKIKKLNIIFNDF